MEHRVGAIPFDIRNEQIALLFVTSQRRGRWILPKGLIQSGESHKQCCKREAFEEAGVSGEFFRDYPITVGVGKATGKSVQYIAVTYYPLLVNQQAKKWPEDENRQRHWALLENAMRLTDREDMRQVICQFENIKRWVIERAKRKKVQQTTQQKQEQ